MKSGRSAHNIFPRYNCLRVSWCCLKSRRTSSEHGVAVLDPEAVPNGKDQLYMSHCQHCNAVWLPRESKSGHGVLFADA